jgi:DNA polymerase-3 subunit gamma/tau
MLAPVTDRPESDPADEPMLGMELPAAPASASGGGAYRVLARKYRPQRFSELIGQDAMVQTLANAIRRDRLAHAFLMTGVRGVGKTSTARLIAKGLNCIGADGQGGPTIDPCGVCEPCVAIAEGRHIDVIEMDAASHTGVDDVREIIEAVRYAAVSARYKIYIIDEVHMLSKNAFNALLKTLEEPPAHVKFLFATTEVNKVPVTVLSRCQRFDLRRITPDLLFDHFRHICGLEGVEAEDGALRMIAAAAEGSVRDGLSILDQAIAHADLDGEGRVTAAQVQDMLGLSDGGATRRLFGALLAADAGQVIDDVRAQYALGVDPLSLVRGLMRLAHGIALTRAARADDPALTPEDRAAVADWAARMGMAAIQRLWQLLLRAHDEVARAADPLEAAEMALLRIAHASTMPDPDDLARLLAQRGDAVSAAAPVATAPIATAPVAALAPETAPPVTPRQPAPPAVVEAAPVTSEPARASLAEIAAPAEPPAALTLESVAAKLSNSGELMLGSLLRREARLVSVAPGLLRLQRSAAIDDAQARDLAGALTRADQSPWQVELTDAGGAPTLGEQAHLAAAEAEAQLRAHPVIAAALATFPDAELARAPRDATRH